jgi:hypothetical protein
MTVQAVPHGAFHLRLEVSFYKEECYRRMHEPALAPDGALQARGRRRDAATPNG